jgi:hypothetical protein
MLGTALAATWLSPAEAEAESIALYPGEELIEAAGYPALVRFEPGRSDLPCVVFVTGGGVLGRIAYGPPGARADDFLCHWLHAEGFSSLVLTGGKTVHLGGPGTGYSGDLVLSPDGTGSGSATTDDKKKIKLQGTWKIKDDTFCRTWKGIDKGKEVCETWLLVEPNKVKVLLEIGSNWWD